MKIKAKTFNEFVKKISLGNQINELVFDFTEEGLKILAKTPDNICMANAILNLQRLKCMKHLEK